MPVSGASAPPNPSLPAGINEDESDPMGPDRATPLSGAIQGHMPPRFGGGLPRLKPMRIKRMAAGLRSLASLYGRPFLGPIHGRD